MNKKVLEAIVRKAAKILETAKGLKGFNQMLTKMTDKATLDAELDAHLRYYRHQSSDTANSRFL